MVFIGVHHDYIGETMQLIKLYFEMTFNSFNVSTNTYVYSTQADCSLLITFIYLRTLTIVMYLSSNSSAVSSKIYNVVRRRCACTPNIPTFFSFYILRGRFLTATGNP